MRGAPAVGVTLAAGAGWRAGVAALAAGAAAASAAWLAGHLGAFGAAAPLAAAAGVLAAAAGWRSGLGLAPRAPADLRFDGTGWQLDGAAGRPMLALDLGGFVLLRFAFDGRDRPDGAQRRRWVAASEARSRGDWHGLRVALHAPAASAGPAR